MLLTGGCIDNCGDRGILAESKAAVVVSDVHVKRVRRAFVVNTGAVFVCLGATVKLVSRT